MTPDEEIWAEVHERLDRGLSPLEEPRLRRRLEARPALLAELERLSARLALLAPTSSDTAMTTPARSGRGPRLLVAGLATASLLLFFLPSSPERPEVPAAESEMFASTIEVERLRPSAPQPLRIDRTSTRVVAWTLSGEK